MKFNTNMDFVVTDAEYQTYGETRETGWTEAEHYKEIFQIAAVKVISGEIIGQFNRLIRPIRNPILTPQSIKLTGITQEMIDADSVSYREGYSDFLEFIGDLEVYIFDNDENVHLENACINGMPIDRRNMIKVKERLFEYGINPDKYSSGTLHRALDLDIDGHVHNALHDSHSLAFSLIELKKNGTSY